MGGGGREGEGEKGREGRRLEGEGRRREGEGEEERRGSREYNLKINGSINNFITSSSPKSPIAFAFSAQGFQTTAAEHVGYIIIATL